MLWQEPRRNSDVSGTALAGDGNSAADPLAPRKGLFSLTHRRIWRGLRRHQTSLIAALFAVAALLGGIFLATVPSNGSASIISGIGLRPKEVVYLRAPAAASEPVATPTAVVDAESRPAVSATLDHDAPESHQRHFALAISPFALGETDSDGRSVEPLRPDQTSTVFYDVFQRAHHSGQIGASQSGDGAESGFAALEVAMVPEPAASAVVAMILALVISVRLRETLKRRES